jgi:hypothetical protein
MMRNQIANFRNSAAWLCLDSTTSAWLTFSLVRLHADLLRHLLRVDGSKRAGDDFLNRDEQGE